jgi:3'-phosphoadenosine 5'-phosphosulfate sulfotransferase (PAPS reductase)/FAD synthetase
MAPPLSITPEIAVLLAAGAPVAVGVSGGKDGSVAAIEVYRHLDSIGHPREKRLLVHSDLGRIEWSQSLPVCEELAKLMGTELLVLRRKAGDMIDRWEQRWANIEERYCNLELLTVTLPWSTASMRFCTSELKTDVITSALKKRFPGESVINVTGIRREESANRAKAPISKANPKLTVASKGVKGYDWHPILEFKLADIWACHKEHNLPVHAAYTVFGSSRVSCSFCIMSSLADLAASFGNPHNREAWALLVDLELRSGFSFQSGRWLCDLAVAPADAVMLQRAARAKALASERESIEADLSPDFRFTRGVPGRVPSLVEAEEIARARNRICGLYGWTSPFVTAATVRAGYEAAALNPLGQAA